MKRSKLNKLVDEYEKTTDLLAKIAGDPKTDSKSLIKLSKLTDSYILANIATNRNAPSKEILEKWLEKYCGDGGTDEEMRIHIVFNQSLRKNILKKIIKYDSSPQVREAALTALAIRKSESKSTTAQELMSLYKLIKGSKSVSHGIRQKVAIKALKNIKRQSKGKENGKVDGC